MQYLFDDIDEFIESGSPSSRFTQSLQLVAEQSSPNLPQVEGGILFRSALQVRLVHDIGLHDRNSCIRLDGRLIGLLGRWLGMILPSPLDSQVLLLPLKQPGLW